MKLLICGAGIIGSNLGRYLAEEGHEVNLVEQNEEIARKASEKLDVRVLVGSASMPSILEQAGVAESDMVIAVTNSDLSNLAICSLAAAYGSKKRIARIRGLGLNDVIKHNELDCRVEQLVDLVANALVLDELEREKAEEAAEAFVDQVMAEAPAEAAPLAGRKVLVVDDEDDVRLFLRTVFEDAGAEVCEASDGDEGIAMAVKEKPDLISLDITMPEKSGVAVYRKLKEDDRLKGVPVIIVTGISDEFERFISTRRQVPPPEGYISKPVDAEEFARMVKELTD